MKKYVDVGNNLLEGRALRLALMSTHYRKPLDWSDKKLDDARKALMKWYKLLDNVVIEPEDDDIFVAALYDDINTPKAIARLHELAKEKNLPKLIGALNLIGLGMT